MYSKTSPLPIAHAALTAILDAASTQLQAKLGAATMDNELLYEKISRLEAGRPLARRRSRR